MDTLSKPSPAMTGILLAFTPREVESFFVIRESAHRRPGRRLRFSYPLYRAKLQERITQIILDHQHSALEMTAEKSAALYSSVQVLTFSVSRERRPDAGEHVIRMEYRIGTSPGRWRQTFRFLRTDISLTGGLTGKLYTIRRRYYAD